VISLGKLLLPQMSTARLDTTESTARRCQPRRVTAVEAMVN